MQEEIGIFGGDVYRIKPGRLERVYDNWWCDKEENESIETFFLRSKKKA